MQTQKRTPSNTAPVAKAASPLTVKPVAQRSKPVELDVQSLRHVAGGVEAGPKKYW
ncbi:MAG: hypothetical protein QM722_12615 [Piscinibacter sp.]